jgi:hypothetical protein
VGKGDRRDESAVKKKGRGDIVKLKEKIKE